MGFLGKLFGTDEAMKHGAEMAHEATTGIIAGIDAAWYTKEEQAKDIKDILFKLQDQYTPRSMSRRIIAVLFAVVFCAFALTALVFACMGKFDVANSIISVAGAFNFGGIMLTIVVFYFGYYGAQKILGKGE